MKQTDNFIATVGLSMGNADLATQICMFVIFFLVGQFLRHTTGYRTGYATEKFDERARVGNNEKVNDKPLDDERLAALEVR